MYLDRKLATQSFLGRSVRATLTSVSALALLALAGCGANYRPVVSAISPVGPAAQPSKFALAISTNPNANGLVTFVDFAGDTILDTTALGFVPYYFTIDANGSFGYTLNCDGTLNTFTVSTSLIQSQVLQTTLLPNIPGTLPSNLPCPTTPTNSIYSQGGSIYVTELGRSALAQLQGEPAAIKQEIPTGANTIYTVGAAGSPRAYSIVQGATTSSQGHVAAIETTTQTLSATLPVGNNPIYGVMTADSRRAFILNEGSNSVSVINSQTNALDTFNIGSTTTSTIGLAGAPVWADFAPTLAELVVANQGINASSPGSVSIISIPLCNAVTVTSNPNCDTSNPVDAAGFGTVLATVPVGINPVQVAVLADGSRAYVINAGNPSLPCSLPAANQPPNCSVSVINLTSNTVTQTIPFIASTNGLDLYGHGRPNWLAVTNGTPTGKVYVTAVDSSDLTVIRTDIDSVTTHVALQGLGVSVRVTAP